MEFADTSHAVGMDVALSFASMLHEFARLFAWTLHGQPAWI